ncbi:MAG: thiamine-phosphate kinase [Salinivirgaceae bacterium]|nr:thiamine-phosphate kinase [Salinivirgaceae bacterium]
MAENNAGAKEVKELGEFGLIEHLTKDIKLKHKSSIKGVGDDAAVLNYSNKQIVVTTDLLTEGVHFDLMYVPIKHLGYKAVMINLSDVYAMNATPKQITVSIAVSGKFSLDAIELLYEGIHLACESYNVDLIGGDTCSSLTGLTISITAIGEVDKGKEVYRNGAKIGDLICVSGDLGGAYAGLQVLEREKAVYKVNPNSQPDMSAYDYVLERQLKPEARIDIVEELAKINIIPTAMIDISDGLSSEIIHICKQSKCGAKISEAKLPIHDQTIAVAEEFDLDPTLFAMNGGEDYELLFTLNPEDAAKANQIADISIIGEILPEAEGIKLHGKGEGFTHIKAQGWNAYEE